MRRIVIIAALAATCALLTAATAYASVPRWYWAPPLEEIPAGKPVPVSTAGTITLTVLSAAGKKLGVAKCTIADREVIENPASGGPGTDSILSFSLANCASKVMCATGALATFNAAGFPWPSVLIAGTPILDEIKGVAIEELCGGAVVGVFTGVLKPAVKGTALDFTGAASGTLVDGGGETMTLKGADKLTGPSPKTKISAK